MTTYKITHENRPAARIQAIGETILNIEVEAPGIPDLFAPVSRHAHREVWDRITESYENAPENGYTVTAESLLTLTDYETAPIGTTASHRHFDTSHTKRQENQWHDIATGETISDEYMAQRGSSRII